MIQVFRDRDGDRKVDRIAPAPAIGSQSQAVRGQCGFDVAIACAAVLLPPMSDQDEPALDDRDLFGILGLSRHFHKGVAALRTGPIRLVEFMNLLDDREFRLGLGTMTRLRRAGAIGISFVDRAGSALGLVAEQRVLAADQELFQKFESVVSQRYSNKFS